MNTYIKTAGFAAFITTCSAYYLLSNTEINPIEEPLARNDGAHQVPLQGSQIDRTSIQVSNSLTATNSKIDIEETQDHTPKAQYFSHTFSTTAQYEAASQFGKLPTHMSDVRLEELPFDANNAFIVNEKIKHVIEFFLLAKDEEGQDIAVERLREYIDMTLPSPAKEQALALATSYLAYKDNLVTRQFSDNTNLTDEANLNQIKIALDERKNVRRQYLGETNSNAIFGYEESYDDFSFKRLEINANTNISAESKDRLIAQAEQSLPKDLAEKMRYKRESKKIEQQISRLKLQPGNELEIYKLRKEFYGEKVADRMAYLEDNSPDWQHRVEQFHQQQQLILSNNDLNNDEKNDQLNTLKEQSFSYKEQVKLAVQHVRG